MKVALIAIAAVAIPLAGCGPDPCRVGPYCDGTVAHYCGMDYENRPIEAEVDCSDNGRTCLASNGCVYADQPCTRSRCEGSTEVNCGASGFVTSRSTCVESYEPTRTCIELPDGLTTCGYPAAPCTDPAVDSFCSADGTILYSGCDSSGFPIHATPCWTGSVCATGNGTIDCVDPARIPCEGVPDQWPDFCSADMTAVSECSPVGLVTTTTICPAGQNCTVAANPSGSVTARCRP